MSVDLSVFGLLDEVSKVRDVVAHPSIDVWSTHVLHPYRLNDRLSSSVQIRGVGTAVSDPELAQLRAAAECVERLSLYWPRNNDVFVATAAELGAMCVPLSLLPRCSIREAVVTTRIPDSRTPLHWCMAVNLVDGSEVFVPATYVWFGMELFDADRLWAPISTGCAAHTSLERATWNAIAEVCERDLVAVAWDQMLPLPRVPIEKLNRRTREILEWQHEREIYMTLYDASTDVQVPIAYGLERTPFSDRVRYTVHAGTGRSLDSAAQKVLREASSLRGYLHREAARDTAERSDENDLVRRALFMARPENSDGFAFLANSTDVSHADPAAEIADSLAQLVRSVADATDCPWILFIDITPPFVRDAGFHVARVFIPGLQPLPANSGGRYRAHPRLYELPTQLGHRVRPESELNPFPQPFP